MPAEDWECSAMQEMRLGGKGQAVGLGEPISESGLPFGSCLVWKKPAGSRGPACPTPPSSALCRPRPHQAPPPAEASGSRPNPEPQFSLTPPRPPCTAPSVSLETLPRLLSQPWRCQVMKTGREVGAAPGACTCHRWETHFWGMESQSCHRGS